jgi:membrane protease YdiL (CAAX protease family)
MERSAFRSDAKELIAASIIAVLMAFMDISGLPSSLFMNVRISDIEPFYFTLMLNFVLTGIVCFLLLKAFCPHWTLGLKFKGTWQGLKKYGLAGIIALIVSSFAFYIGLQPFDYLPTFEKTLIEGFIYYIGVGIIEELYVRGLILNIIEKLFRNSRNAILWAVVISSVLFGLGHVFGALGSSPLTIVSKVTWTIGLGLYWGSLYKKTNNLWVPIILHIVMDFCGVPFCFSTTNNYPTISLIIILPVYILLGVYGLSILIKKEAHLEL